MNLPRLIPHMAMVALVLLGASCSTYRKMPGKYVVYDSTPPASPKSYVEFFTYDQWGGPFSNKQQTIIKMVTSGKKQYIGQIGIEGCERLRLVLPPGDHHFHVGPGINDADLSLVTQKDKVIPVETNSSTSVGAQLMIGVIGALATTKCDVKVGSAKPCNPNDREWIPLK